MTKTENRIVDGSVHGEVALPHISVSFNTEDRENSVRTILQAFRPELCGKLRTSALQVQEVVGGVTNKLVVAFFPRDDEEERTLFRVYGEETNKIIDREAEIRMLLTLHKYDCYGKVYGIFGNGMCYQYMPGEVLTWITVKDDHIRRLIAERMAEHHSVSIDLMDGLIPEMDPFEKMSEMLQLIPEHFEDIKQQHKFEEMFPHPQDLATESEILRKHISDLDVNLSKVFCHNDLAFGNILYDAKKDRVSCIDFEYAGCNFAAYDIANHFNEYAGVDDCTYERFPTSEYQRSWLKHYLQHLYRISENNNGPMKSNGEVNSADEVERLFVLVSKFTLVSHLLWIIWSLVQAKNSSVDFDFITYGKIRYDEYLKKKEERLAQKIPSKDSI